MDLKDRLKQLRTENNMSQQDLADKLNELDSGMSFNKQMIYSYEKGSEPPMKTLLKISKLFNVSLDYLVGISDHRNLNHLIDNSPREFSESAIAKLSDYTDAKWEFLSTLIESDILAKTMTLFMRYREMSLGSVKRVYRILNHEPESMDPFFEMPESEIRSLRTKLFNLFLDTDLKEILEDLDRLPVKDLWDQGIANPDIKQIVPNKES